MRSLRRDWHYESSDDHASEPRNHDLLGEADAEDCLEDEKMLDDFDILIADELYWTTWFPHEYFWLWVTGFVLSLLLLSRALCGLIRGGVDKEMLVLVIFIAVFGSVMAGLWHVMMLGGAMLLMLVLAGAVIAGIPLGLGYACARWHHKKSR